MYKTIILLYATPLLIHIKIRVKTSQSNEVHIFNHREPATTDLNANYFINFNENEYSITIIKHCTKYYTKV